MKKAAEKGQKLIEMHGNDRAFKQEWTEKKQNELKKDKKLFQLALILGWWAAVFVFCVERITLK